MNVRELKEQVKNIPTEADDKLVFVDAYAGWFEVTGIKYEEDGDELIIDVYEE